ncbi:YdaU family protein [Candidatus Methylospira mobilis]|uniref:YdaU family protein n=1 Tax=Candidatus Methylospira mobilis TaxID=1808979 RepID=A0A5Q0BML4_9GAMM|nr:YdaU family protein [Candidatus Methylospira mobilis]QFY42976.1 YdaU family protein [Candidatus Methylospira mobilis]
MNYFPFHIGDYISSTRHLTWDEDCAYRRLMDVYYTTEKPLPLDERKLFRLVLASTDAQREAVSVVIEEFFTKTDGGWVNKRADSEIASMREKQSEHEIRSAHERDRMSRHRERRSEMFSALREVGVVPAWDISMKELQRLFGENCEDLSSDEPETHLKREQAVAGSLPATAIPIPTPIPTPVIKEKRVSAPPERTRAKKNLVTAINENFEPSEAVLSWYARQGYTEPIAAHVDSFVNKCKAKNYRYADWDAAFRNAITDDWARSRTRKVNESGKNPMQINSGFAEKYAGIGQTGASDER